MNDYFDLMTRDLDKADGDTVTATAADEQTEFREANLDALVATLERRPANTPAAHGHRGGDRTTVVREPLETRARADRTRRMKPFSTTSSQRLRRAVQGVARRVADAQSDLAMFESARPQRVGNAWISAAGSASAAGKKLAEIADSLAEISVGLGIAPMPTGPAMREEEETDLARRWVMDRYRRPKRRVRLPTGGGTQTRAASYPTDPEVRAALDRSTRIAIEEAVRGALTGRGFVG